VEIQQQLPFYIKEIVPGQEATLVLGYDIMQKKVCMAAMIE
jgi:hypothetical protein